MGSALGRSISTPSSATSSMSAASARRSGSRRRGFKHARHLRGAAEAAAEASNMVDLTHSPAATPSAGNWLESFAARTSTSSAASTLGSSTVDEQPFGAQYDADPSKYGMILRNVVPQEDLARSREEFQGAWTGPTGDGQHLCVACWGNNHEGQAPPAGVQGDFVAIAAGYRHSLALRRDGSVACWGNNWHGQAPPDGVSGPFKATQADL
ncbi:hypothetical protein RI054_23g98720 [Pseudoscourfieldia marina]